MDKKATLPIYAFIDGQNLQRSTIEQGWKLDHKKFRVYLKDKLQVTKAFYFLGFMRSQQSLYNNLKKSGYTLVFKTILKRPDGSVKGDVDVDLVFNAMVQYHKFGQAVIVTGDGDYHCLLEYLEKTNKLGGIVIPNKRKYSSLLRRYGNKRYFVSDLRNRLEYIQKK